MVPSDGTIEAAQTAGGGKPIKIGSFAHRAAATLAVSFILALPPAQASAQENPEGRLVGGIKYEIPGWFKESFLDLAEDAEEAAGENRHVLLYFHLNECPYCERMLRDGFENSGYTDFIRENFDSIAINIKGDRVVAYAGGEELTERALSKKLKVRYTPTILFLDRSLKPVLRLNGYRSPERLKLALDFVQQRAYENGDFPDYVEQREKKAVYTLRDHPLFRQVNDFRKLSGPVIVIFEDASCEACDTYHDKLYSSPQTLAEMEKFTVVRLDADSGEKVIDFEGNVVTPGEWAKRIGLSYRPGIVLYDGDREITRIDGLLYGYHFNTVLKYVADRLHERYPTYNDYLPVRREELLRAGKTIDYDSFDNPVRDSGE